MSLEADAWFQRRPSDPTTQILNPGILFNGQQLGQFLGGAIGQALIAAGVPPAQAQAQAAALATGLATVMAKVPVGAAAFNSPLYTQPYLVFSYQNSPGYINVHGFDLAADFLLPQGWSVADDVLEPEQERLHGRARRDGVESSRRQYAEAPCHGYVAVRQPRARVWRGGSRPVR